MARVRKQKVEPVGNPGSRVDVHAIDGARALVTVGPEHAIWAIVESPSGKAICEPFAGALVRVRPPDNASETEIASVVATIAQIAAKVQVLQPRRSRVVVSPREKRTHKRAREVVDQLVGEANVDDRPALAALCESIMGKQGL